MVAVTKFGTGPKVLVIHGGPGFNSNYLIEPLRNLSEKNTFIFYDQSYQDPTLEGSAKEFLEVVGQEFDGSTLRIVAHSWGCLVLVAALAQHGPEPLLDNRHLKPILINPVPITKPLFDTSVVSFQQRIPAPVIQEAMHIAQSGAESSTAMAKLLPYYVANQDVCNTLSLPLSLAAYQAVLSSLPDFDLSPALSHLAESHVMVGEHDITPRDTIQNILSACQKANVISGSGHFPLHEKPEFALPVLAGWLAQR